MSDSEAQRQDLAGWLSAQVSAAFAAEGLDPALGQVRRSDRPDLAPFQCNGAMAAAKAAKRNPRDLAAALAARLSGLEGVEVEAAGPGFLNFTPSDGVLEKQARQLAADFRCGAARVAPPRRVIVDYGGPNVAKPMHVGHLRASIIGESLKRLFRFRGDTVWGDAHFGDWGFQMGLLIAVIDEAAAAGQAPAEITLDWLQEAYPKAAERAKSDPAFRDLARKTTARLQSGDPHCRAIWAHMREVSLAAQKVDFASLGVDFDLWLGEADADPYIEPMVADLQARGLLEEDQGARVLRVANPGETKKKKLDDGTVVEVESPDPLLVVSSEGSAMYGTTDLATIVQREKDFAPDLYLYVVDQRQADHFEQVFRAAAKAGYAAREKLEHIGFGTMNGPDGKPFKTRAGGVLKLSDLIEQAREKARARLREAGLGETLAPDAFEATAHAVGVAAIKFADLMNFRGTSYVFDLDRFVSFEGKTGPYLQYALVRMRSLQRKAAEQGLAAGDIRIAAPAERQLVLALDAFEGALETAYEKRAPHVLAEHAFSLAQAFSAFYDQCPVLSAPEAESRSSRLGLAALTERQLALALDILGIEAPARM